MLYARNVPCFIYWNNLEHIPTPNPSYIGEYPVRKMHLCSTFYTVCEHSTVYHAIMVIKQVVWQPRCHTTIWMNAMMGEDVSSPPVLILLWFNAWSPGFVFTQICIWEEIIKPIFKTIYFLHCDIFLTVKAYILKNLITVIIFIPCKAKQANNVQ